jgi:CBS domain-containing protein
MNITSTEALPVLNKSAQLVGIVTDRDLFSLSFVDTHTSLTKLGIGDDEDSWTWEGLRNVIKLYYEVSDISLPEIPVKEVMATEPTTVFEKTEIGIAAREMRVHDFGQLPVRDSQDRLAGMIYDFDVVSSLYDWGI